MKKFLLLAVLAVFFSACKQTTPPKQIAQDFIKAVATNDNNAVALSTDETNSVVTNNKTTSPALPFSADQFAFAAMTESINGEEAQVKNNIVSVSLKKESEGWRVIATSELLNRIQNRLSALEVVKEKWEALQKEYDGRLQVAKDYVQYKKGLGTLSAPLQNLEAAIKNLSATPATKETVPVYVQKQKNLGALIDKSLEPTYTAGSDLSMNYIIQMNDANNRIKTAEGEYQTAAEKTPSSIYPLLNANDSLK